MSETSEPITDPIDLRQHSGWVYRLWNMYNICLYIGQTRAPHPWIRINGHRSERWWREIAKIDYIEVYDRRHLNKIEQRQIREHHPVHNIAHNRVPGESVGVAGRATLGTNTRLRRRKDSLFT
jgi:hypothetical protein